MEENKTVKEENASGCVVKEYWVAVSGLREFRVRAETEEDVMNQLTRIPDSEWFDGMDWDVEIREILPDEDRQVPIIKRKEGDHKKD